MNHLQEISPFERKEKFFSSWEVEKMTNRIVIAWFYPATWNWIKLRKICLRQPPFLYQRAGPLFRGSAKFLNFWSFVISLIMWCAAWFWYVHFVHSDLIICNVHRFSPCPFIFLLKCYVFKSVKNVRFISHFDISSLTLSGLYCIGILWVLW